MEVEHPCPECGGEPTDESLAEQHLSDLGYLHDDRFLECRDCGEQWTIGIPRGDVEDDKWICDACGGDMIPHFAYIHLEDGEFHVRPKCKDCYYIVDEPIVLDITEAGNHDGRVQFEHHTVTGELTERTPHEDV